MPLPGFPINGVIDARELPVREKQYHAEGYRTGKRAWRVRVNGNFASPADMFGVVPVARYYPWITETETDVGLLAMEATPRQTEEPWIFIVEVNYSSKCPDPARNQDDPLAQPPTLAWSVEKYRVARTEDQDGLAYVNSAGEPLDPPPEGDRSRLVLAYSRNVDTIDHTHLLESVDVVNDAPWYGFDTRLAKVEDHRADIAYQNGVSYWKESFQVKIDEAGWLESYLDQGYYKLVAGIRTLILDNHGRALTTPSLLNGAGGVLPVNGTPQYIKRRPFADFDFSELNIP